MNTEEKSETGVQDRQILLTVGALVAGLLCCCTLGLAGYMALIFSMNPLLLNPGAARETATAVALQEINSVGPLGTFYFGKNDVNDACQVITQVDEFSQEDFLRNEYIFVSASFDAKYEDESVDWSIYDMSGRILDEQKNRQLTLDGAPAHCLMLVLFLSPATEPGEYILEVKFERKPVYREVFSITYSDLSKIPRPTRQPFSDFTFGRSIDTTSCTTGPQSSSYTLAELKESPWFYLASPFQLGDVGGEIYWSVKDSNGEILFDRIERTIYDDIDLCFWQGFSMEGSGPAKYTLVIEDDQSVVIYQTEFELK